MTASAVAEALPLADLAISGETLIGPCLRHVENATVYTNISELNPAFGEHLSRDIYVARTCQLAPIALLRLAGGTLLHGGNEFLITTNDRLVREQIAPYLRDDPQRLHALLTAWRPLVRVREECLLLARYGLYTWGHWLAELLPKLVIAEAAYPGRFRYVLPVEVLSDANPESAAVRLRESLLAYGLHPSRILPLQPAMDYEFEHLHAISAVWSDHIMHPTAAALMRDRLTPAAQAAQPLEAPRRVALLRTGPGRSIGNQDAISDLLTREGFSSHTVGAMPFLDQVRLFRSASLIFAILGSDLTGLIYAPEGVRVISVAPAVFGDRFFYALILDRNGRYADLRGPIATLNQDVEHRSSFLVEPSQVRAALAGLGDAR